MQSRLNRILENFILIVIILVLVQTFLEDFAILSSWPLMLRQLLLICGFVFDVIFTIEFLARGIFAASRGTFRQYFLRERGWIDFLASIPLLFFNSGPDFFALITGGGAALAFGNMLQVLKVIKAIRIARVLRLLRVLKIFRRIKNAEAIMAQRHVARIATMIVTTIITALLLMAFVDSLLNIEDVYLVYEEFTQGILGYIEDNDLTNDLNLTQLESYARHLPILLLIKEDGRTLYSRYNNEKYAREWTVNDYAYFQRDSLEIFINIRHLTVSDAKTNMRYFLVIVILTLVFMFIYSPHFALTISDPIHVMRKGFDEASYNLQVRIPDQFEDDEIYLLARSFNKNYLPLKDRENHSKDSSVLEFSLADFTDLGDIADSEDIVTDSDSPSTEGDEEEV